jgi:Flp pilus assembly pilin Flp
MWSENDGKIFTFRRKEKLMNKIVNAFWKEQDGQDMVEYALLLAFVALAAVAVLSSVKGQINNLWSSVSASLQTAGGGAS